METAIEVPANEEKPVEAHSSPAGILVLQWLTYAFWGWLILGMIWLMSIILINAMLNESVTDMVPYAIAASVVMLPIAFVCDLFYRKHEPLKKAGGAMVIMMIHAVLFALLGIGALIATVFIGVNTAINVSSDVTGQMVALIVMAFAAVIYAATFLRVLNPFKGKKLSLMYGLSILTVTIVLLVLAIVGPVVKSVAGRGDRVIEQNLPSLQASIDTYITENNKLPGALSDVTITNKEAKQLVDEQKVEYNAVGSAITDTGTTALRYQLCVTYSTASRSSSSDYDQSTDGKYSSYISTYAHGAGRTCYKIQQEIFSKSLNVTYPY